MKLLIALCLLSASAFAQSPKPITIESNKCASPTGMLFVANLKDAIGQSKVWTLAHDPTDGVVIELVCANMTFGGQPDQIAASVLATWRLKDLQPVVVMLHTVVVCDKRTSSSNAAAIIEALSKS